MNWSQTSRILLVIPSGNSPKLARLDIILILRHCDHLGCQLAVVTDDRKTKSMARQFGIPTFSNVKEAQNKPWRRADYLLQNLNKKRWLTRREIPPVNVLAEKRKDLQSKSTLQKLHWALRYGIFTIGVLSIITLVFLLLPSAEIMISPEISHLSTTLNLTAKSDIDTPSVTGNIPLYWQEVAIESKGTITATGTILIPDEPARGSVVLTNQTDETVVVPKGTIVMTSESPTVRFATNNEIILSPTNISTTVEITAQDAGEKGNVHAGKINTIEGPLSFRLTVINPEPTSGGRSRLASSPSEQDKSMLYEQLTNNAIISAQKEFKLLYGETMIALEAPVHKEDQLIEFTPDGNEPSDFLELHLIQVFSIPAIYQSDLNAVAKNAISAMVPDRHSYLPDSIQVTNLTTPKRRSDTTFTWQAAIKCAIQPTISSDSLIQSIMGQPIQIASQIMLKNLSLASPPTIHITPSWWQRIPFLPFRITISVKN